MYVWISAGPSRGIRYLTRRRHQQNSGSDGRCMAEGGVAAFKAGRSQWTKAIGRGDHPPRDLPHPSEPPERRFGATH